MENKMKLMKDKIAELNQVCDKANNDLTDKLRTKDIQNEKLNEEIKQLRSTVRSSETTISYFRKKVEELNKHLEEEKTERVNL